MVYQAASRSDPRASCSSASMAMRAPRDVARGEERVAAGQVERGRDLGVGVVDAVERLEGHAVEVAGLLVGEPLHGAIGGPAAGVDGLVRAARRRALVPVVGEVGEAGVRVGVAGGRLQQLGDACGAGGPA